MIKGLGNKDIGKELDIFSYTVKKHRAQVLDKMQVNNLHELLILWDGFEPQVLV
jgi:FixJ family two-component response regulator